MSNSGTGGNNPAWPWSGVIATCAAPPTTAGTYYVTTGGTSAATVAPRVSDADIERIAQRVAQLLKGG